MKARKEVSVAQSKRKKFCISSNEGSKQPQNRSQSWCVRGMWTSGCVILVLSCVVLVQFAVIVYLEAGRPEVHEFVNDFTEKYNLFAKQVNGTSRLTYSDAIVTYWNSSQIDICENPENYFAETPNLSSYRFRHGLEWLDVEVRSQNPLIVRFPAIISQPEVQQLLSHRENPNYFNQKVADTEGSKASKTRRATGIYLERSDAGIRTIHQRLKRMFLMNIDDAGEMYLMLKYQRNGHYAPHFDTFEVTDESPKDWWMLNHGNRIATFLLIVKGATGGGGTVFPTAKSVIVPNAGDVIFWLNTDANEVREQGSLHGACPITDGEKLAVSLWVRARPQTDLVCALSGPQFTLPSLLRASF